MKRLLYVPKRMVAAGLAPVGSFGPGFSQGLARVDRCTREPDLTFPRLC